MIIIIIQGFGHESRCVGILLIMADQVVRTWQSGLNREISLETTSLWPLIFKSIASIATVQVSLEGNLRLYYIKVPLA